LHLSASLSAPSSSSSRSWIFFSWNQFYESD
jgi:hypothetical protein